MDIQSSVLQGLLEEICGCENVITDQERLYPYGQDQTLNWYFAFDILIRPGSAEELGAVLKLCGRHRVSVTPRGGGTGVTGGALPAKGGLVISLERFNKILKIEEEEGYVVAEAGVITSDLCDAVEARGFYLPVAPGSRLSSFVGGNVASNAGGVKSCKYGTTARWVLNLEVVLPTGEIIWTGSNVAKNSTGLDLTRLFVGSEGVLGIISKVVYRLIPKPVHELALLAEFETLHDACQAVIAIKRSGVPASGVELIGRSALEKTAAWLQTSASHVKNNIQAQLLIELEEPYRELLDKHLESILSLLGNHYAQVSEIAFSQKDIQALFVIRSSVGAAMRSSGMSYRDIDACVPLSRLYEYIVEVEAICSAYGVPVVIFGHALDGNLHTMLLTRDGMEAFENQSLNHAAGDIYRYAISIGGVISGEHGIGLLQKQYMPMQFSDNELHLMRNIKRLLDPHHILNSGKIFDPE